MKPMVPMNKSASKNPTIVVKETTPLVSSYKFVSNKEQKKSKSTLSSKEIIDRRADDLCFHYDDTYHPGQDCKARLYMIFGEKDEELRQCYWERN